MPQAGHWPLQVQLQMSFHSTPGSTGQSWCRYLIRKISLLVSIAAVPLKTSARSGKSYSLSSYHASVDGWDRLLGDCCVHARTFRSITGPASLLRWVATTRDGTEVEGWKRETRTHP